MNAVTSQSSSEEKIALFGALFRGRDDVYPRRFESVSTGRSGYQPACANEWARGVCDKPKTRCALCGQRKFIPVTAETIRWHLSGKDDAGCPFVMGTYPLLLDEHCHFAAADFDKATWREDVVAVARTCADWGLPVAVERSRSGNGAHLWWFFSEPLAGNGTMEVDLVCQDVRLAIELDGAQHFSDLSAYRRDRRKDMLPQENGYRVLRFLAEDVCEQLNDVLDGILWAMAHLKR